MTEREPYKFEPHNFNARKIAGKPYCCHCGLVALNNEFTRWAVKMGCNNGDHPQHDTVRKSYTGALIDEAKRFVRN